MTRAMAGKLVSMLTIPVTVSCGVVPGITRKACTTMLALRHALTPRHTILPGTLAFAVFVDMA